MSLYQTYREAGRPLRDRSALVEALRDEAAHLEKNERWFRSVADYTCGWETWDSPEGKLLFCSNACQEVSGFPAEEFLSGKVTMLDLLSPRESAAVARHFMHTDDGPKTEIDFRIVTRSGEERWISHVCQPIHDEQGRFAGRRAANRDITARKRAEMETRVHLAALHRAPVPIMITDRNAVIEYVNPKVTEATGYAESELLGQNPRLLQSGEHDSVFYQRLWATLLAGDTWVGELRNRRRDGSLFWELTSVTPITDKNGEITKFVAVNQDITERKAREATLHYQANFDALTGIPNRVLFDDRLGLALKKLRRHKRPLALMMIDLDRFKDVNDSYGHASDDELLRQAVARMQACVRGEDTLGRLGGDEFILLLEDVNSDTAPRAIARRILEELARPFIVTGVTVQVSGSIGVVLATASVKMDTLKQQADIALYKAKRAGRNCVVFHGDGPDGPQPAACPSTK